VRDFWEFSVKFARPATDDFSRSRIDHMIDLRHPLAVLASRMPWQQIGGSVAHLLSRKARSGIAMPDLDLFGEQVQRSELKHAFNEPDERVALSPQRETGDRLHAVLCAAGYNIRWLLRMIAKKGIRALLALLLRLLRLAGWGRYRSGQPVALATGARVNISGTTLSYVGIAGLKWL
jgi:hypothetical protein